MADRTVHPLKDAILTRYGSYDTFAALCDISRYTLWNIVSGHSGGNSQIIHRMAEVLGVSFDTMRIWCRSEKWVNSGMKKNHPLVKAIRKNLYTTGEFAIAAGLSKDTIDAIVNHRSKGYDTTYNKIAKALNVSPELVKQWCIGGCGEVPEFHLTTNEKVTPYVPKNEYQFVVDNVRLYGNSIIAKKDKVNEVLDLLKENGFICKARHVPKRGRHDKEYWVIEQ